MPPSYRGIQKTFSPQTFHHSI
uniref:Uncharacterized protein n=1 Tax=Moniliophthora roreri TaxID=221103 RepID=A0A0W0FLL7_MONRR